MDMAYLHPQYFKPDVQYLEELKLKDKIYFLLRFVNWNASHDLGQSGFSAVGKSKVINFLSQFGEVIISSEGNLPSEFKKYLYKGDPLKIHTILQYARLFVSESGSMATEAAILGTPSVMVNSSAKYFGVFEFISEFGNLFYYDDETVAFEKIKNLLDADNVKVNALMNAQKTINHSINLTNFMVWFIENYPSSYSTMKENPNFQLNFK